MYQVNQYALGDAAARSVHCEQQRKHERIIPTGVAPLDTSCLVVVSARVPAGNRFVRVTYGTARQIARERHCRGGPGDRGLS
jgi:hypothetical protein